MQVLHGSEHAALLRPQPKPTTQNHGAVTQDTSACQRFSLHKASFGRTQGHTPVLNALQAAVPSSEVRAQQRVRANRQARSRVGTSQHVKIVMIIPSLEPTELPGTWKSAGVLAQCLIGPIPWQQPGCDRHVLRL